MFLLGWTDWFGCRISAQEPKKRTLLLYKACLEPVGLLSFSISAVFPMQCKHANGILEISCKWFWFLSIRKFSLVIMCSELSLQAVPPHLIMLLRSLNLDLGFKMKASTTMPSETTLEVRGHRETRLIYIHAVRRTLAYISGTFHVHFMSKPCRIKVAWLFQLLWVILWSTWLHDCAYIRICQRGSFVLVPVHSRIFLGNYVFCATPFDHVLAKFEFRFGFQDEGVFNDAFGDNPRGQGPPGD